MSPAPEAAAEPEQQTTTASAIGAETSVQTPPPGTAAPRGEAAGGAPTKIAYGPAPFVPEPPSPRSVDESRGSVDGAAGWASGQLDRRPELGLAAGFTGGFLLAAILRRLGR